MIKTKKSSKIICLAVVMMFLFASIASAAVLPGLYLGGDVNQYVSMDYFWANDGENQTEIAALMTEAGLPNVVYVDDNQKYAILADLAAGIPLDEALQPLTSDNLDDVLPADGYADIENPENIIVPSLPPVGEDYATAYVNLGPMGFTEITVLNTTVDGVAKFKVSDSTSIADLNSKITIVRGFDGASTISTEVTLLTSDGTTVLASGILTYPASSGNVTFNVTTAAAPVDTAALAAAIAGAQAKVDAAVVGDQPGNYPQAAVDALESAIADATAVKDNAEATQAEVDAALADLQAAVAAFNAAKIAGADTATANVTVGMPPNFVHITVTDTNVDEAVKFKVDVNPAVADLGSTIPAFVAGNSAEVSLLASDGTTVLATGTLTWPNTPATTTTGIVFDVE